MENPQKGLQRIIDLFKSGDINIHLTFRIVTKATKLMKKYALATKTTNKELVDLFRQDQTQFWSRLNEFIADEYNEDKDEYGTLTTKLFGLVKQITGTEKAIEDIEFFEVVELIQSIAVKIQEEQTDNFLPQEGMELTNTIKQLDITESEKKNQKKEKVKS